MGLTTEIKSAPNTALKNAPKMGISAINATNTEIRIAYGKRKMFIPIKQRVPKIQASVH